MNQKEMFYGHPNSAVTNLLNAISAEDTTITVEDGSKIPDAPNILTIGPGETSETVRLTYKNGNALTVTRGLAGTNQAWRAGAPIGRVYTSYDQEAFVDNIRMAFAMSIVF